MSKKKKPMWPIYAAVGIALGALVMVLTDWERYPTEAEMKRFIEYQYSNASKVEVAVKKEKDAYVEAQVYEVKIYDEKGDVEEQTYTVYEEKRKSVYPWHDYYADRYKANKK